MNKTLLTIGIIFLFASISINPTVAFLNSNVDTKSPVTTNINFRIRGLMFNPIITEEYVKFFALIVLVTAIWDFDDDYCTNAYDMTVNSAYESVTQPNPKTTITPGIYLFQSLTLPNNYTGKIGLFFIDAIFSIPLIEYPIVTGEGTSDQIKLTLVKGGTYYNDGYNITNDVVIFVNGTKVSSYTTETWVIDGEILLGFNGAEWGEGYNCPEGDYEVTVAIKNYVVFDGAINVG
jgi:hypothetical protein